MMVFVDPKSYSVVGSTNDSKKMKRENIGKTNSFNCKKGSILMVCSIPEKKNKNVFGLVQDEEFPSKMVLSRLVSFRLSTSTGRTPKTSLLL